MSRTVRLRLTASVVLAMVALGAVLAGGAGATSGGVGPGGSGGSATASGTDAGFGPTSASHAKYARIWDGVSIRDRRWARRTAECESGGDPRAIGGGGIYRGAFQFMRSTWKRSPKSPGGDPIAYPYRTQAVVAVMLMRRDGAGHWPVCG